MAAFYSYLPRVTTSTTTMISFLLGLLICVLQDCQCTIVAAQEQTIVGFWTTPGELSTIPATGCGWDHIVQAAQDADPTVATIEDQDSNTNVQILAAAIVWARTQDITFRTKVTDAIATLVASGQPLESTTLAWAREVGAYVIAADLIGYRDDSFDDWLLNVSQTWKGLDDRTLLEMFYKRPNNWGSHAFASLAAIYAYSNNTVKLDEIRSYWVQSIVGPKPLDLTYGSDVSWHPDINDLRLINPLGSSKNGFDIDGIIPDDMRRGGAFSTTPASTGYPWEFLQGQVVAARIMERMGMPIWDVGDDAIARAVFALQVRLDADFGGWAATGDDEWLLPFIDDAYQTNYSTEYDICDDRVYKHGKNAGWPWVILGDGKEMSSTPTILTTATISPSSSPTVSCDDDPLFTFQLFNGQTRTCKWLTKNERKSQNRISRYCKKENVQTGCQATCDACFKMASSMPTQGPSAVICYDDPSFLFQLDNGKVRKCPWLTRNQSKTQQRISNYCPRNIVQSGCPDTCNSCP